MPSFRCRVRVFVATVGLSAALLAPAAAAWSPALADTTSPSPTASSPTSGTSSSQTSKDRVVTFGIQPASDGLADSRPFYSWGATPGSSLTDHVALLNYSRRPLVLDVYATDAFTTVDGAFGLLPTGERPTGAGSWITLHGDTTGVRIPPRHGNRPGELVIPVTATIPADATPGDHPAGILAVLTSTGKDSSGANVTLEQRVGTRVFVRVSGDLRPSLAVENLHATYHGAASPFGRGSVTVTYTLHNTGNVRLGANGSTTISGLFTDEAIPGPKQPLLLPGAKVHVSVNIPGVLPQLRMTSQVNVTPLAVAGDQLPPVKAALAETGFWAVPWLLVALVILLLVVVGVLWWRRRRRSGAPPPAEPHTVRQPEGVPS